MAHDQPGFTVDYLWSKPDHGKPSPKITHLNTFAQWG